MAAGLPLSSERHRAAPKPALLWILGLAGVAFCACTAVLASLNEELYQPALRVLLVIWLTLPFILAGIVAWRRRPDSAFGPLMIVRDSPLSSPSCSGRAAGTQHHRPAL